MIDWSDLSPARKPTAREVGLYRRWRVYLKDSKLTVEEQHKRACEFAERKRKVPKA
jgi:hypothetical protein